MTEVLQFGLLGLGAGAIYALMGQGLVLIYRGSGVLNLAHGAFAMAGAYLYYELRVVAGQPLIVALAGSLLALAVIGVLTDQLLLRRLRRASTLARLIGTLGVLLVIQSIAALRYGATPTLIEPLFSQRPVEVMGATVAADRLWLVLVAIVLTAALTVFGRWTRFGWAMSAVAENQQGAAALGWSPERISAFTWGLGATLAALAGILVAPVTQLSVTTLTLTVIPALAAALIAGFISFPVALLGGLLIGIAESEVQRYVGVTGAAASVPFFVIVAVLALRGSSLPMRGYLTDRLPTVGRGRISRRTAALLATTALLLICFVLSDTGLAAVTVALGVAVVLMSLVVLTGYTGQLSLAQFALAGIGALIAARLVSSAGVSFVPALVVGTLGAGAVGLLFALPALRTRGVELAVVTLGLGAAAQALLFNNAEVTGSAVGTTVGTPSLFGLDLSAAEHPVRYALFALGAFALCAVAVANLRRGSSGRCMLAVRTNERAAAAIGINVFAVKLYAFALGGALAGLGGVLLGFRESTVIYTTFGPLESIGAVAEATIGGVGYLAGPLIGSVLAPGSVGQQLGGAGAEATEYLPLVSGVLLLALLIAAPDGVADVGRRLGSRWRRSRAAEGAEEVLAPSAELTEADGSAVVPSRRLSIESLSVRYGGVLAVDDLSFEVAPGRVVGLIGPNGAGKTSVIDAIAGFSPAAGRIELDGTDIGGWSASRRARAGLGRTFQGLELFEDMTVLENLQAACGSHAPFQIVADLARPSSSALPAVAAAVVRSFRLEPVLGRQVSSLSYGDRRHVAVARAIAAKPSVLLLDEPAAGLDSADRNDFARLVRGLADERGIGILVIEHDLDFVMSICDELLVLDFGRLVARGTPDQVRGDPAAIAAYLGEEAAPLVAGPAASEAPR